MIVNYWEVRVLDLRSNKILILTESTTFRTMGEAMKSLSDLDDSGVLVRILNKLGQEQPESCMVDVDTLIAQHNLTRKIRPKNRRYLDEYFELMTEEVYSEEEEEEGDDEDYEDDEEEYEDEEDDDGEEEMDFMEFVIKEFPFAQNLRPFDVIFATTNVNPELMTRNSFLLPERQSDRRN